MSRYFSPVAFQGDDSMGVRADMKVSSETRGMVLFEVGGVDGMQPVYLGRASVRLLIEALRLALEDGE